MTGNKEKLDDFVKIIGGTVTFRGGDGKITGKGTIRTSKLNFENVYYVEELQNFNLFSVSQICDKKNKVVLRVPRRHNLYSFNLTEIQPERDINCLLAKASSDESTKWHRRMAHVNFKNINKLAKHGLVNVLPSTLHKLSATVLPCNKESNTGFLRRPSQLDAPFLSHLQLHHMDLLVLLLNIPKDFPSPSDLKAQIPYLSSTEMEDILPTILILGNLTSPDVAQALNDSDWVEVMQEEMQQFINQKVWKLVPLPTRKIAIGTKWILKNKRDARGIVLRE
ncbi:ribonuclease H-like domain-containing protein [Tanacetum coccineum]